jgi:hypothetical protein
VKLPGGWSRATPIFDDEHLVSFAGLAAVLALAERAGLSELIEQRVSFKTSKIKSAGVNPAGKLTSVIAGMAAGADCIDDLDVVRCGGMSRLFGGVYAASTLGQLLREFTHGHALQLASVARVHLVNLVRHSGLLPGIAEAGRRRITLGGMTPAVPAPHSTVVARGNALSSAELGARATRRDLPLWHPWALVVIAVDA